MVYHLLSTSTEMIGEVTYRIALPHHYLIFTIAQGKKKKSMEEKKKNKKFRISLLEK